jgi:hypothetical protein
VYSVGWYVEAQGARKDPALRAFEGLSANELATSSEFYSAMTVNAAYDRTIFIKLAMALQTDLMIRGLVEELQISPRNSVSHDSYTHIIYYIFHRRCASTAQCLTLHLPKLVKTIL